MSDDSFFNNPTVQQILQKQGIFDNEQSTADFIKDLLMLQIKHLIVILKLLWLIILT